MASVSTTSCWAGRVSASLEVHLLGLVDFDSALFLQERLVYELSGRDDTMGGLLLCEHPPMITLGRDASRADVLADVDELTSRQMEVRWLNRGGGCFVHAPGQLAIYPVVPLDRLQMELGEYRRLLEESVIDACRELKVRAYRQPNFPGVWSRCGQLAHVGFAVRSWVAYHGLFINVSAATELLGLVKPEWGGRRVTSLAVECSRANVMHTLRASMIGHLASRLGYEETHLYTGHPLLRRTKKRVYVGA